LPKLIEKIRIGEVEAVDIEFLSPQEINEIIKNWEKSGFYAKIEEWKLVIIPKNMNKE